MKKPQLRGFFVGDGMKLKEDKTRLRSIYLTLIEKAVSENGRPSRIKDTKAGYENHHIIPKKWGSNDHPLNLVRFTYRQHFVAHLVLCALMETRLNLSAHNSRAYEARQAKANESRIATLARMFDETEKEVRELAGADLQRSEKLKGRVYTCPHCGKSGGGGMTRWHFDNCKLARK